MKNKILIIFITIWMVFGCAEQEEEFDSMAIEFGTACGWCAGTEFIILNGKNVEYKRNIPCGENKGTTSKNKTLSDREWKEIRNSFDYHQFVQLPHDECNVCVDGCDEILKITQNENEHRISYSPSTEIEGMENLLDKLQVLMAEFRD